MCFFSADPNPEKKPKPGGNSEEEAASVKLFGLFVTWTANLPVFAIFNQVQSDASTSHHML